MRNEILAGLDQPGTLEKLYRTNKSNFRKEFSTLYPEISGNSLAEFWHERLNYESDEISWGSRKDFLLVLLGCLLAGILAKIPAFLPVNEEFFYMRNIGFLVFPFMIIYFAWKNGLSGAKAGFVTFFSLASLLYVNLLPHNPESDTLILACIHLPLLLWVLLGVAFTNSIKNNFSRRLEFLRFNGDLAVMTALLLIAGGLMTGITIGLFSLIGLEIEKFYFEYVVIFALPAVPIFATHLTRTNPQLVNKVSPVIARIFSPLVLVMLVVYLGAIIFSGKDPYTDREFLLLFNLLLIGVMALIFFSVAENSAREKAFSELWVLLLLSFVTIVINGIALSAIVFRISEWGITPNRLAVLGANILILFHLFIVTSTLLKGVRKRTGIEAIGNSIVKYIPVYFIWILLVIFLFPLIFQFK